MGMLSVIALAWIQRDTYKWKTFAGNRVAEIQDLVSPTQWHHCSGKENPADAVTYACVEQVADVGVPHHSARWLAEEAEPRGKRRSSGSVYFPICLFDLPTMPCLLWQRLTTIINGRNFTEPFRELIERTKLSAHA